MIFEVHQQHSRYEYKAVKLDIKESEKAVLIDHREQAVNCGKCEAGAAFGAEFYQPDSLEKLIESTDGDSSYREIENPCVRQSKYQYSYHYRDSR